MALIMEQISVPDIVKFVLRHAGHLLKWVQKATWAAMEDSNNVDYDAKISYWLDSTKFTRQSLFHAALRDALANEACEFLLEDDRFNAWYDASDSQRLVVLGDMGCGKTMAMAFIVDELRRRKKREFSAPLLCYHYCRDDETGQAICILSSLILQLLEQESGRKGPLVEWCQQVSTSGNLGPASNAKELDEMLQKLVQVVGRPIYIVIDGLDVCDQESRHILLGTLSALEQRSPGFKTLLSSRPHEEILEQLNGYAQIELCPNLERDRIIADKIVEKSLRHLQPDIQALVAKRLTPMVQGSAIWTKMVIELIARRQIRAFHAMQIVLEKMPLPEMLSNLYASLFERQTLGDSDNERLLATALEILAVARRPLSVMEIAWAAALGVAEERVITVDALAKLVDHQRVMSLVQGFVCRVDFGDVRKRQVRLVHHSVREFILTDWLSSPSALHGQAQTSSATENQALTRRVASLESKMLNICIHYLLLEEIGQTDLFSDQEAALDELPQGLSLFDEHDTPDYDARCTWEVWEKHMLRYDVTERGFGELFVYASCYWLDHFGTVTTEHLPSLTAVERLCQAGSIRLGNWVKQHFRPECTIKARFEFDSTLYDPLSITALYGSDAMLSDMLEKSNLDTDMFLPHSAMSAADQLIQWSDLSRLKTLFRDGKDGRHPLRSLDFFRLVIRSWFFCRDAQHRNWDAAFELVDDVSDVLVKEKWGNELLCVAASMGCMPVIRRLMDRARGDEEFRAEVLDGHFSKTTQAVPDQAIGEAVLGNYVTVVEYLLQQPGIERHHLRHRNSRGENVLHLASGRCNPFMYQILTPRLRTAIHEADDQRATVLMRIITSCAAPSNRRESARIVLLAGKAEGWSEYEQQRLLWAAARIGDVGMYNLMVRVGKMTPLPGVDM